MNRSVESRYDRLRSWLSGSATGASRHGGPGGEALHKDEGKAGGGGGEAEVPGHGDAPYRLRAISHSLGGACMLMYVVLRRRMNMPHRLSRIILMSPAGEGSGMGQARGIAVRVRILQLVDWIGL